MRTVADSEKQGQEQKPPDPRGHARALFQGEVPGSVPRVDGPGSPAGGQESAFLTSTLPPSTPTPCGFDAAHPRTPLGEMLTHTVMKQNCLITGTIPTPTC